METSGAVAYTGSENLIRRQTVQVRCADWQTGWTGSGMSHDKPCLRHLCNAVPPVHAAVAQFDHLGGESRVCRFHIAVAGFVYQAEKVGFRQQEIIHGSVNFENYTLFSACAHEYNWQKTRQKIKNPTLNFTKCWISEV